jgi:uncharacterized membrane protein YedE/YeeE
MNEWEIFAKAYAGGVLIGISATLLLVMNGRIAGISGIVGGAIELKWTSWAERNWRLLFILGMLSSSIFWQFSQGTIEIKIEEEMSVLVLAGLLVGFGTRLGSGCTSGHGVCGIGRQSARSIVATVTFILSGVATVAMTRMVWP